VGNPKIEEQIKLLKPYLGSQEKIDYLPHNFEVYFEEYHKRNLEQKTKGIIVEMEVETEEGKTEKLTIKYPEIEIITAHPVEEALEKKMLKLNEQELPATMYIVAINKFSEEESPTQYKHQITIVPKSSVYRNPVDYEKAVIIYLQQFRKEVKNHSNNNPVCRQRRYKIRN